MIPFAKGAGILKLRIYLISLILERFREPLRSLRWKKEEDLMMPAYPYIDTRDSAKPLSAALSTHRLGDSSPRVDWT